MALPPTELPKNSQRLTPYPNFRFKVQWLDSSSKPTYVAGIHTIGGWTLDTEATIRQGIVCGERAIELDPRDDAAYAALGFVLGYDQDHPRALQIADRGVALNPNNPAVFLSRAVARFYTPPTMVANLEAHGDAIASDARSALQLSPLDPGRWAFLYMEGMGIGIRGRDGDLESALARMQRAAHEPNRAWQVHGDCALLLLASGRYNEARAAVAEAAERKPDLSKADFERVHHSTPPGTVFLQGLECLDELESDSLRN